MPEVPPTRTPVTTQDMTLAMLTAWQNELGSYPTAEQLGVLLAQWSLETANGASMVQFNVGNSKAPHPGPNDLYCYFATKEFVNGAWVTLHPPDPGCRFAAFASLDAGCQFFLHGFMNRWKLAWPFVLHADVPGFANALHLEGYYTAPVAGYTAGMQVRLKLLLPVIQKVVSSNATTLDGPLSDVNVEPDVTPDLPNDPIDDPSTGQGS